MQDYEFQLVQSEAKKGDGTIDAVRLVDKRTGKAVPDAVISKSETHRHGPPPTAWPRWRVTLNNCRRPNPAQLIGARPLGDEERISITGAMTAELNGARPEASWPLSTSTIRGSPQPRLGNSVSPANRYVFPSGDLMRTHLGFQGCDLELVSPRYRRDELRVSRT